MFNLRAGRWQRGRIPGSRCNRKLKHERSQSSNKPAPPPSRYTPGKGKRSGRRRRRRGGGQEYITPTPPALGPSSSSPSHLSHANEVSHLPGRTHTHTHSPPRSASRPAIPGVGHAARRGWHRCRCPVTFSRSAVRSLSPPPCFAQLSLKPLPTPSGLPRPGKSPCPCRPLRGAPGPRWLRPSLPGRRPPGRTWDVGVGSLLVGQPIPAAHGGLRAPALHQEGSGHGEGTGHGWARSGAAASAPPPARPPRRGCAAVRGSGTARTGQSR